MTMKKVMGMLGLTAVGVLVAATMGETAQAENRDECLAVSADQTVNWGANQVGIQSPMSGLPYGHANCAAYVVDVNVTHETATISGYKPQVSLGGFDPERETFGAMTVGVPRADCGNWEETVAVYKKGAGQSAYAYQGGGVSRGAWNDNFPMGCTPRPAAGFRNYGPFTPPSSGTDVYRVIYSAHLGSAPAHAAVAGSHLPQIQ
jgi:hypothetical protein